VLAEIWAGRPLGAAGTALAPVLRRRTSGNPLLVSELLAHLVRSGTLGAGQTGGVAAGPAVDDVPASVSRGVRRRLAGLGDDARRLAEAAAVIGHQVELPVLA
jgi:predicted ATPase